MELMGVAQLEVGSWVRAMRIESVKASMLRADAWYSIWRCTWKRTERIAR